MEEYEEKGIPVYPTLIASCAATIAALLIAGVLGTPWLWFVAGLIAMLFAIGSLVVRSMHREVMSRRWGLDILRGWEKTLLIPALVLYPASAALGAADLTRGQWSMMPSWTLIVGFFLLATGYVLVIQALQGLAVLGESIHPERALRIGLGDAPIERDAQQDGHAGPGAVVVDAAVAHTVAVDDTPTGSPSSSRASSTATTRSCRPKGVGSVTSTA